MIGVSSLVCTSISDPLPELRALEAKVLEAREGFWHFELDYLPLPDADKHRRTFISLLYYFCVTVTYPPVLLTNLYLLRLT